MVYLKSWRYEYMINIGPTYIYIPLHYSVKSKNIIFHIPINRFNSIINLLLNFIHSLFFEFNSTASFDFIIYMNLFDITRGFVHAVTCPLCTCTIARTRPNTNVPIYSNSTISNSHFTIM